MANRWRTLTLNEILRRVKKEIRVNDELIYKQVTVRLWNKGVILRGKKEGKEIKTKRQFLVRTGQLVLSRIDVRNGAIGICPDELDGAIVSNDFWVYDFVETLIIPKFLSYFVTTPGFLDDVNRTSSGTTKRIRADENAFLRIKVPLPPMDEQRRIVACIEALAARVNEAQSLRRESADEARNLIKVARNRIIESLSEIYPIFSLSDLCVRITDGPHISPNYVPKIEGVPFISVRNVSETGLDFSTAQYISKKDHEDFSKRVNVQKGDVLFTKVGSTGIARRVDIDMEFSIWVNLALLKPKHEIINNAFMEHMLNAPRTKEHTLSLTYGSSTQYIGVGKIGRIEIPVPPMDEQRRVISYLDNLQIKANELQGLQADTQKELDALLPSILDKAFKGEL